MKTAKELLRNIRKTVENINNLKLDNERAHGLEDELFSSVLTDIAYGDYSIDDCQKMAKEALKSTRIDFDRWCA